MPMMKPWFYSLNGEQKGPVSLQELQQLASAGMIDRDRTLVWTEGMTDWVPAGNIPEIFQPVPTSATHNPYATPATLDPRAAEPHGTADASEIVPGSDPLDVGAIVRRAWDLTFQNFGSIILVGLIFFAVTSGTSLICSLLDTVLGFRHYVRYTPQQGTKVIFGQIMQNAGVISQILPRLVSMFLSIGVVRIGLDIVDGKPFSFELLFSGRGKFLRVLGASILFGLMVAIGMVFLLVPGIYLGLRYGQYFNLIVDKDCGIMESFRESARLTEHNKANLFVLGLAAFGIVLLGVFALCVGLLAAIPITWLMRLLAYRWLQRGRKVTFSTSRAY